MKYIILADSRNGHDFEIPRHLTEINGEKIVERTIRLLKENGVKDIIITSHDERFNNLDAKRYEPLHNDYDPIKGTGYWINAFPEELLIEPVCFIWGDVYFSENAIKTIVETDTDSTLFFCTYNNNTNLYIKPHDEPLAYKVVDYKLFKKKIKEVKKLKDEGKCCREPVVWELYRRINNQEINEHVMTNNYVAINDESCDIDEIDDIWKMRLKLGLIKAIKVEVIEKFSLAEYDKLKNVKRIRQDNSNMFNVGDTFECSKEMCEYLTGNNDKNKKVVKVIEVVLEDK